MRFATKEDFDAQYSIGAEHWGHPNTRPEVRLNYNRAVIMTTLESRADQWIDDLGLEPEKKILIAGAAFGWTAEILESRGFDSVLCVDNSPWVHTAKTTDEIPEIKRAVENVGIEWLSDEGRNLAVRLKATEQPRSRTKWGIHNVDLLQDPPPVFAGSNRFDVVISEDMIGDMEGDEAKLLDKRLRAVADSVCHYWIDSFIKDLDEWLASR